MIITVVNQKGGVGKTTTAVNLAAKLAERHRTLLVDTDVQGHAATCLGLPKGNGLFRLLVEEEPVKQVVMTARPNLDLVTSDKRSERIKLFLNDQVARELYIAQVLEQAAAQYERILLDLAPGSDILHVGSLVASDYCLIPAGMEFLALDGVAEVIKTIRSLARIPNVVPPRLIGVLPTRYERRPNDQEENLQRLQQLVGVDQVLPPIPKDVHLPEAAARGLTIWEYAPDTPAAIGYRSSGSVTNSRGGVGGYLHLAEIVEAMVR